MPKKTRPHATPDQGKVGVIDIGSNSIRLVVYDAVKRVPVPIYNEKAMCALGRGLGRSGTLDHQGKILARQALARLLAMARLLEVDRLSILATAAIRDAQDGRAFVKELEKAHGVRIEVISGEREAQLAGCGVLASVHAPRGLAGDLGGGSMELVALDEALDATQVTLPIGPLRLADLGDEDAMRRAVREALQAYPWHTLPPGRPFYAVGGSFRALAALQMEQQDYPLRILHHYSAPRAAVLDTCALVRKLGSAALTELSVPAKRAPSLPAAAIVLEEVLALSGASSVVFCASGIREGYLFDQLARGARKEDPLIASCRDISQQEHLKSRYGRDLFAWSEAVFATENASERRLREAFCLVSELAWHIHPEYRAAYAFERLVHSTITGLDHGERVSLALAMHHRYKTKSLPSSPLLALTSERQRAWAQALGVAAHLAFELAGGMPGNLSLSNLHQQEDELILDLASPLAESLDEKAQKRIHNLAKYLSRWRASGTE